MPEERQFRFGIGKITPRFAFFHKKEKIEKIVRSLSNLRNAKVLSPEEENFTKEFNNLFDEHFTFNALEGRTILKYRDLFMPTIDANLDMTEKHEYYCSFYDIKKFSFTHPELGEVEARIEMNLIPPEIDSALSKKIVEGAVGLKEGRVAIGKLKLTDASEKSWNIPFIAISKTKDPYKFFTDETQWEFKNWNDSDRLEALGLTRSCIRQYHYL